MKNQLRERRGLKKYLGQEKFYTGRVEKVDGTKLLLLDLRLKDTNKILADHVWIDQHRESFKVDDVIDFQAIARSYKDTHGVRKYGLDKTNRLRLLDLSMDAFYAVEKENFKKKRW